MRSFLQEGSAVDERAMAPAWHRAGTSTSHQLSGTGILSGVMLFLFAGAAENRRLPAGSVARSPSAPPMGSMNALN